jgi:hypothetical protein
MILAMTDCYVIQIKESYWFVKTKVDGFVISQKIKLLSFRPGSGSGMTAKPESSHFNSLWTPAPAPDPDPGFAGVTGLGLFARPSRLFNERHYH